LSVVAAAGPVFRLRATSVRTKTRSALRIRFSGLPAGMFVS
jgi:hypothetical protein